jgi:hypothetical protein
MRIPYLFNSQSLLLISSTKDVGNNFKYTCSDISYWVRDMHEMRNFKTFYANQLKIKDHVYKI